MTAQNEDNWILESPVDVRTALSMTFPNIVDGKIDTKQFLAASQAVLNIIDKFGKVFVPIKYDMQVNIEKILRRYSTDIDAQSTLQDLILLEKNASKRAILVDALLWLSRALRMIQLFLERIVVMSKAGEGIEDLVANIKDAYKEALEPYHGWMAQQLFGLLSRIPFELPSRTQVLLTLADNLPNQEETTLCRIENFSRGLKVNLMTLRRFMHENQLGVIF